MASLTKKPETQNQKCFFHCRSETSPNLWGLEQLSRTIVQEDIPVQTAGFWLRPTEAKVLRNYVSNLFFRKKKASRLWIVFLASSLTHAKSPFSELQMNYFFCLLWHFKLRPKKSTHLCFHKVLLVSSLHQSGGAWRASTHHIGKIYSLTTYSLLSSLLTCPASSAAIRCIFELCIVMD